MSEPAGPSRLPTADLSPAVSLEDVGASLQQQCEGWALRTPPLSCKSLHGRPVSAISQCHCVDQAAVTAPWRQIFLPGLCITEGVSETWCMLLQMPHGSRWMNLRRQTIQKDMHVSRACSEAPRLGLMLQLVSNINKACHLPGASMQRAILLLKLTVCPGITVRVL